MLDSVHHIPIIIKELIILLMIDIAAISTKTNEYNILYTSTSSTIIISKMTLYIILCIRGVLFRDVVNAILSIYKLSVSINWLQTI